MRLSACETIVSRGLLLFSLVTRSLKQVYLDKTKRLARHLKFHDSRSDRQAFIALPCRKKLGFHASCSICLSNSVELVPSLIFLALEKEALALATS